jgi:hypothetical protein
MIIGTRSARRWAAAGVPMRTLQEWMGHRDLATTAIYADRVPNAGEVEMVDRAFADPLACGPREREVCQSRARSAFPKVPSAGREAA